MKIEMEKYISKEYQEICNKYNSKWQIDLKNLNEDLLRKGQINSGIAELRKYELVRINVTEMVEKFEELLFNVQKDFNRKLINNEIKEYIDKCINTTKEYIDSKEKLIIDNELNGNLGNSLNIGFDNLRGIIVSRLNGFYEKSSLINNGIKIDINITLSLIGIIIGLLSLIATIYFGILPFLK